MRIKQEMKANILLKLLMLILGITFILFGCSTSDEWEEEVSKSPSLRGTSFLTSHSPTLVHTIDFQEMSTRIIDEKDKKITYESSSLRIYYGEYGSKLVKYKELTGFNLMTVDHFEIKWQGDSLVMINVYREAKDGTRFKAETIRLDTSI
ncbi:hypothetical protein [Priestia endophytica]|uniref:hypothetical protein n=1 Tax=Priestia endophytica TaxID=135735 RepID=UPI000DCA621A|nr:hypothetical protein [Priestia endophytica]RAS74534.1 hypothetical protein A4R27_23725 [Priestia endophytica]RAS77397.1 hypothetical protein A4U60_17915 [Priestia endophytica]